MNLVNKITFKATPLSEYTGMMYRLMSPYKVEELPLELTNFIGKIQNNISPLILSDLTYLNTKLHMYNVPKYFATYEGIESVDAFISLIEKMNPEEFWSLILEAIFSLPSDASDDQVNEMIKNDDYLSSNDYSFEAIIEFKTQLHDLLPRIVLFFKQFNRVVFKPLEEGLMEAAERQRKLLEQEYLTQPESFIKHYIKVNSEEFLKNPSYKAVFFVGISNYDSVTFTISNDKPEEMFIMFGFMVAQYLKEEVSEELVKSIGESTKLSMIKLLAKESMYASQLADALSLNRATISHHIYQLIKLGIIRVDYSKGKKVYYGLNIETIREGFERFVGTLERKGDAHE